MDHFDPLIRCVRAAGAQGETVEAPAPGICDSRQKTTSSDLSNGIPSVMNTGGAKREKKKERTQKTE